MHIVKFHGYWQDRTKTDDRPRVIIVFFCQKNKDNISFIPI
jgi:hypothetical protein